MNSKKNFDSIQINLTAAFGSLVIPVFCFILFFKYIEQMNSFAGDVVGLIALTGLAAVGYFFSNVIVAALKELKDI